MSIPLSDSAAQAALADLKACRNEYLFQAPDWLNRHLLKSLNDKRDGPMLSLVINILLITVSGAIALYVLPASHLAGGLYMAVTYVLFLQRFLLTLHFSQHRPLFKKGFSWLNHLIPYLLSPLFGVPSGMYKIHHCIMHHGENNHVPFDISSTEPYQRDSLKDFFRYWVRFAIASWIELPYYALKRKRYSIVRECVTAEVLYWVVIAALWKINPIATLWVFVLPFCVSSFALMFGNWSQHIFVDGTQPKSDYRHAYNCLNCPDNQRTFNDGYHIIHHLNSKLHWSELPLRFLHTIQEHQKEDALLFEGIGFFDVGVAVFTRRYDFLVSHMSIYSEKLARMSHEEKVQLLKSRLRPVSWPPAEDVKGL